MPTGDLIGYIILDKNTGAMDWDSAIFPTAQAAIDSMTDQWSGMAAEPHQLEWPEKHSMWHDTYAIHPVGAAIPTEPHPTS